jgi:hypothetical protein
MIRRYLERLDVDDKTVPRGFWVFFAIFFAAALGFELGSLRYGHGDTTQLVFMTAFLLMSASHLTTLRWLCLSLRIASMPLMIIALVMLLGYHPLSR